MCYIINTFWKFLWLGNLAQDFLGVKFWSLNSFRILFEALRDFGCFDFCPHSIIPVTLNPEYFFPSVIVHFISTQLKRDEKILVE